MKPLFNRLILTCLLGVGARVAFGQEASLVAHAAQQVGAYRITLRLPVDGLVAGEEQQIELRIVDTSADDPVLGPAPVIRALVQSSIAMPAMPAMPKAEEVAHPEGVPGDYGLHPTFAHGGEYVLTLFVTPLQGAAFSVAFPLTVLDELPQRKSRGKPFKLELATQPDKVKAGTPTDLRLRVWGERELRDAAGRPNGKRQWEQLKAFETMHERLLHLIIVRRDLNFFAHTHPVWQSDGSFLLAGFVFPTAGEYQLFADTAPKGMGTQVLLATLKVSGSAPIAAVPLAAAERATERDVAGVRLSIAENTEVTSKKTAAFIVTFHNTDNGVSLDDLETYLGAFGHLLMIHADAQTFVHAHPDEREPQNGRQGRLIFLARPPKAGLYRAWIEFQRGGVVQRADFVIEAREAKGAERAQY